MTNLQEHIPAVPEERQCLSSQIIRHQRLRLEDLLRTVRSDQTRGMLLEEIPPKEQTDGHQVPPINGVCCNISVFTSHQEEQVSSC